MSDETRKKTGSRSSKEQTKAEEPVKAKKKKTSETEPPREEAKKSGRSRADKTEEPPKAENAPKEEPKEQDPSSVGNQLCMLLLVVLSIFIGICYAFREEVGVLGFGIQKSLFGLFGVAAFILPFLLLQMALFWRRDVLTGATKYKYLVALCVMIFLSFFCHTVYCMAADVPKMTFETSFTWEALKSHFAKGTEFKGGGFFGGLITSAFVCAVGYPGAILFGLLFLAGFVLALFGLTPMECFERYRFYRMRAKTLRMQQEAAREEAEKEAKHAKKTEENAMRYTAYSEKTAHKTQKTEKPVHDFTDSVNIPRGDRAKNIDSEIFADDADFGVGSKKTKKETPLQPISEERLTADRKNKNISGKRGMPNEDTIVLARYPSEKEEPMGSKAPVENGTSYVSTETMDKDADIPFFPVKKQETTSILSEETPVPKRSTAKKPAPPKAAPVETPADVISIRPPEMSVPAPATEADEDEDLSDLPKPRAYEFPPIELLSLPAAKREGDVSAELRENANRIIETLDSFNVRVSISNVSRGPTITRYEVEPAPGTRVRSIINLLDDIALSLATSGVRSDGIISGKSAIGIEVPNKVTNTVFVRELIEDSRFETAKSKLTASLGMDVSGAPVYLDIAKMPHLLIAGATGQGKSVCINSIIISLLYKARPDEVKLILIDPKKVELNVYNGLPHLLVPVVFDPKKAAGSLHWAVQEMERRFELIEAQHVRNIAQYNAAVADDPLKEKLPQVVIIIDELADLMMSAPDDVETSICRLAQKARAAGMHLIIGTQRPSTDVITGLIKANIPSRIAFTVSNQIDSRIIIDTQGAEKLIGKGDMLFSPVGSSKPIRVQGSFVSETEIEDIIDFIKNQSTEASYSDEIMKEIEKNAAACGVKKGKGASASAPAASEGDMGEEDADPMLDAAIELAVDSGKISTSLIQRRLSLGYGRAAKLIDVMEKRGIVSPPDGQKPRNVLWTREMYLEMRMNANDAEGAPSDDDPPFDL